LVAEGENVKTVLFLCTGNYYRSRFAEELFNHQAERAGLDWIAQSRGLALERGAQNVGPISPFALHALKEMAVTARGADRFPQQCTADDLAGANIHMHGFYMKRMKRKQGKWTSGPPLFRKGNCAKSPDSTRSRSTHG
jgi:hypothetical protein